MTEQKQGSERAEEAQRPDRPSLASHQASIKNLVSSMQHLAADVAELKQPGPDDLEGSVAGRCAQALDELRRRDEPARSSLGSGYGLATSYRPDSFVPAKLYSAPRGPVARVLDYLRQRYDIPDPAVEAQRLSAELDRAQRYIADLEQQLEQVRGAVRR